MTPLTRTVHSAQATGFGESMMANISGNVLVEVCVSWVEIVKSEAE